MKALTQTKFENIAFRLVMAIIIIVPLWFNLWSFLVYELDKITISRFLVEIIFIAWLLTNSNFKKTVGKIFAQLRQLKFFSLEFILMVYLLIYALATIFSTHYYESVWGLPDRLMGFFTIGHGILLFYLIKDLFTIERFYKMIKVLAFVSLPICVYAILQKFGIDFPSLKGFYTSADQTLNRSFSSLGHPNYLGLFLSMAVILTFSLILKSKKIIWKIIYYGILSVQIVSLILTLTRSAWLAFLGSLFVFILGLIIFFRKEKKYFVYTIILLVLTGVIFGLQKGTLQQRTSGEEGEYEHSSAYLRMQEYKYAWSRIWQRPILGYGPETYMYLFLERQVPEEEMKIDDRVSDRVHNVFLDTLINTGVLGLIAYIFIWAKIIHLSWQGVKRRKIEVLVVASSLAAYFIWINFNFDFSVSLILFFLCLAILSSLNKEKKEQISEKHKISWPLMVLAIIVFLFAIWTNIVPLVLAMF